MYSTSFCVSYNYEVSEYGKYNFAYTLAHAIVLLIDAFGFIIFPKMIDKLKINDEQTPRTISYIRENYISLIYCLVFLALPFFYILSKCAPQYSEASRALYISALTLLPYSNAFGMNTYLIAQNKERVLSYVSMACLGINIVLSLFLSSIVHVRFDLVIFATLIAYIFYTYMCAKLMLEALGKQVTFQNIWSTAFPISVFLPFLLAIACSLFSYKNNDLFSLLLPLFVFCVVNRKSLKSVYATLIKIMNTPNVVDLK